MVSGKKKAVVATVPIDGGALAVNPRTNRIYIITGIGTVAVISGQTNTVTTTIENRDGPEQIAANPQTGFVYATDTDVDTVAIFNEKTNTLLTEVLVGNNPEGIAVDTRTNTTYVVNEIDATLSVLTP